MSTVTTSAIDSRSSDDTWRIGEEIGKNCKGGEVILLQSDLGGGKTTLVQGIAAGMGCIDPVASPSFTISREYRAANLSLHHYDFYRLDDPGVVAMELAESIQDHRVVVAIEWGEIVKRVLPRQRLTVTITVIGTQERHIEIRADAQHKHLLKGLM